MSKIVQIRTIKYDQQSVALLSSSTNTSPKAQNQINSRRLPLLKSIPANSREESTENSENLWKKRNSINSTVTSLTASTIARIAASQRQSQLTSSLLIPSLLRRSSDNNNNSNTTTTTASTCQPNNNYYSIQSNNNLNKNSNNSNNAANSNASGTIILKNSSAQPRNMKELMSQTSSLLQSPLFKQQFFYIVEKGNNSEIIKKILERREWWSEVQNGHSSYHFRWKPTSNGVKFNDIIFTPARKQMVNHIENHQEISSKSKLFINLSNTVKDLLSVIPQTFVLNVDSESYESNLREFIKAFQVEFQAQKSSGKGGRNIWILKPDEFNRGQGISLLNTYAQLLVLLIPFGREEVLRNVFSDLCQHYVDKYLPKEKISDTNLESIKNISENYKEDQSKRKPRAREQVSNLNSLPKTLIIQKYIENPLLINQRKFDIRAWVLVDSAFNFYLFKDFQNQSTYCFALILIIKREGYLRLSSEKFSIRSHSLRDKYVHLTNNAIQKNGKNYGRFENGNIISYADFDSYLKENESLLSVNDILSQIRSLVCLVFSPRIKRKLLIKERKSTFEIFGFDFMVKEDGHVLLIEVNSNPCIEESNQLLATIVPRMINDAFRLTIDTVFTANRLLNCGFNDYAVEGYSNFENIWEQLGTLHPAVSLPAKDQASSSIPQP